MIVEIEAILDIIVNTKPYFIYDNLVNYIMYYTYEESEIELKYNKFSRSIKIKMNI